MERGRNRRFPFQFGVVVFSLLVMVRAVAADESQGALEEELGRAIYAADRVVETDARAFHLTFEGMWMYGPVSGHLQTPSGGRPGTSSKDRPRLGEIGINTASIYDAEATASVGDHGIYLGGQWVRMSEDARLEESLVSQNEFFMAGSRVKSDVKMDWYRVGYRYRIQRGDEPGAELPVEIHSRVGAAIWDFHYRLDGTGGTQVDRSYIKVAPQMGVEMEWHATRKLSVAGEVTSTLPFSGLPWIATAELVGKYRFVEKGSFALSGFAGAGYEKISFHDHQDMSNDINADFGPMVMVGVELRL